MASACYVDIHLQHRLQPGCLPGNLNDSIKCYCSVHINVATYTTIRFRLYIIRTYSAASIGCLKGRHCDYSHPHVPQQCHFRCQGLTSMLHRPSIALYT